jgi:hypothetical protein
VKKFVLASLIGTAVMLAQSPTPSAPPANSAPQTQSKTSNAPAATAKHHKKSKKKAGTVVDTTTTAKPAPAK